MATDLGRQYLKQSSWRRWEQVMDQLPIEFGQVVLDLGCAVGEQSALLAPRRAHVVGIDKNSALLEVARKRQLQNAQFLNGDLSCPDTIDVPLVDGLWSSFVAAYFPRSLEEFVLGWSKKLRPGGWIALVEIDDMFAHEPCSPSTRQILDDFARLAMKEGFYDFHSGRKLAPVLRRLGFDVIAEQVVEDDEFCFQGAVGEDVLEGWTQRLDRMNKLKDFAGEAFSELRSDFLSCLSLSEHKSECKVVFVLAKRQSV